MVEYHGMERSPPKIYVTLMKYRQRKFKGGIEHLLPGSISGWVYTADDAYYEVRLIVGRDLVAKAKVDKRREDVCAQLGIEGKHGFSVTLPSELPPLDWGQDPKLIALSTDGQRHSVLHLLGGDPRKTAHRLRKLLQSEALGMEGHCDGLLNGHLQGWAARRRQFKPAKIWLQTQDLEPVAVSCDQWRDDMEIMGFPNQCGFKIRIDTLPESWIGRSIWCSFDRESQLPLPQHMNVVVPAPGNEEEDGSILVSTGELMNKSSVALEHQKYSIEDFSLFLDELEQVLNHKELLNQKRPRRRQLARWIYKMLGKNPRNQALLIAGDNHNARAT